MEYAIGRLLKGGLGVTWADLRDWRYSWDDIWKMHDILDLNDWVDWQGHVIVESMRNT